MFPLQAILSCLLYTSTVKPVDLGATVVKALLEDGKVAPEQVDELLCGNVLSAGLGQNIGRQVAPVSYTHLDVYKRQLPEPERL